MRNFAATTPVFAAGGLRSTAAHAQSPSDLIRSFYKTADDASLQAEALGGFVAENFKDNNRPSTLPAGVSDKNGLLGLFTQLKTAFPDGKHELVMVHHIAPDKAMVYWKFTGTQSGAFFGIPASNNSVAINGVDIFRTRDGKFVEQWHVEELMSLFAQIGAK